MDEEKEEEGVRELGRRKRRGEGKESRKEKGMRAGEITIAPLARRQIF